MAVEVIFWLLLLTVTKKKSAFLSYDDAKAVCRLENAASGLSLVPWVFGKRFYWY